MAKKYDRIFRKEMGSLARPLLQQHFNWTWGSSEALSDKFRSEIDGETDFLLLLDKDDPQRKHILHLEFQLFYYRKLDQRMMVYYSNLHKIHDCAVTQLAVFLNQTKKKVPDTYSFQHGELVKFGYRALYLHTVPLQTFLRLDVPEAATIAILSDFGDLSIEEAIAAILHKINVGYQNNPPANVVQDLIVLSSLRKHTTPVLLKQIQLMDNLYQHLLKLGMERKNHVINHIVDIHRAQAKSEGKAEGKAEGLQQAIAAFLSLGQFSPEEIARILEVPLEMVQGMQQKGNGR